jgi:hypothetical protein
MRLPYTNLIVFYNYTLEGGLHVYHRNSYVLAHEFNTKAPQEAI